MPDFKDILDIHPNPCVIHINFEPKYANHAFAKFSGMACVEDVLNLPSIRVLFEEEHWPEAQRRYQDAIESGVPTTPKVINHMDVKGNPLIAEISDKVIDWHGEKAMCTFVSVVTDQIRREHQLRDMAHRDDLTNLYNRRYLLDLFNARQKTHPRNQYLAMADIDHFKRINDTFGHPVGDVVLRQLAQVFEGFTASDESAFRLGGEEFAILFWADSHAEASKRMEVLRALVEKAQVEVEQPNKKPSTIHCTVSIGITMVTTQEDYTTASLRADEALYIAKKTGRNRVINCDVSVPQGELG